MEGQEGCARGGSEKALSDSGKLSHGGCLARRGPVSALWVLRWAAVGSVASAIGFLGHGQDWRGAGTLAFHAAVPWVPPECVGAGEGSRRPDLTLLPKPRLPGVALLQPKEPVSARRSCHFPGRSSAISLWPCGPRATPAH